jgi:tRNA 2-thiocytidine biosynthesis protein TtcA
VDLEKTLLRKVGEAIHRFKMIRDGDRVAVALSGGKDSATLLEALLLLQKRAPIDFSVCAFTVEQGKFLRPIEPLGEYLKQRGVAWTYYLPCACSTTSRSTAATCAAGTGGARYTRWPTG